MRLTAPETVEPAETTVEKEKADPAAPEPVLNAPVSAGGGQANTPDTPAEVPAAAMTRNEQAKKKAADLLHVPYRRRGLV